MRRARHLSSLPWPADFGCEFWILKKYPALFLCLRSLLPMWFPDFYGESDEAMRAIKADFRLRAEGQLGGAGARFFSTTPSSGNEDKQDGDVLQLVNGVNPERSDLSEQDFSFSTEFRDVNSLSSLNATFCSRYIWSRGEYKHFYEQFPREQCPLLRSLVTVIALSENLQHKGREAMKSDEYMRSREVFVSLFLGSFFGKNLYETQSFFGTGLGGVDADGNVNVTGLLQQLDLELPQEQSSPSYDGSWANPFLTHLLVQLFDCVGWESEAEIEQNMLDTTVENNMGKRIAVTDVKSNWMGWSFRINRREQLVTGFGSGWMQDKLVLHVGAAAEPGDRWSTVQVEGAGRAGEVGGEGRLMLDKKIMKMFGHEDRTSSDVENVRSMSSAETLQLRFQFLRSASPDRKIATTSVDSSNLHRGLPAASSAVLPAVSSPPPSTKRDFVSILDAGYYLFLLDHYNKSELLSAYITHLFKNFALRYVILYDSWYCRDWLSYRQTIERKQTLQKMFNRTISDLYAPSNYHKYMEVLVEVVQRVGKESCPERPGAMSAETSADDSEDDNSAENTPSSTADCWHLVHHISPVSLFYTQSLRTSNLPSLLVFENHPLKQKNWKSAYSRRYWESRYVSGGDSGKGSYGKDGAFKARFLNEFFEEFRTEVPGGGVEGELPGLEGGQVLELGVGDGAQLARANYTQWLSKYTGVDVSQFVVSKLRKRIETAALEFSTNDEHDYEVSDSFRQAIGKGKIEVLHDSEFHSEVEVVGGVGVENSPREVVVGAFDVTISMDVVYHLVEDWTYVKYMKNLFSFARVFVILFKHIDLDENAGRLERQHVRHRADLRYIEENFGEEFELFRESEINPAGMCKFYVFRRKRFLSPRKKEHDAALQTEISIDPWKK